MTDSQLVALVQRKTVAELSSDEVELLCGRLEESRELSEFFSSRLKWQQYLADVKSRFADERAETKLTPGRPPGFPGRKLKLVAAVGMLGVVVCGFWIARRPTALSVTGPHDSAPPETSVDRTPRDTPPPLADPTPGTAAPSDAGEVSQSTEPSVEGNVAPPDTAAEAASGYELTRFQRFDPRKSLITESELQRWFESPNSEPVDWITGQTSFGSCVGFHGQVKLSRDWPAGSTIRLALATDDALKIHVFDGDHGVTFVHYPRGRDRWAAYTTDRDSSSPTPRAWSLAATDSGRARRSGYDQDRTIELEYLDGQIHLSRGDLLLVSAPLRGAPRETYVEGRALFQGIQLVRYEGSPPGPFSAGDGEPTWERSAAELTQADAVMGGRVVSSTSSSGIGPGEFTLAVDEATAGAKVWLGPDRSTPLVTLRYVPDSRVDRLCIVTSQQDPIEQADIGDQPLASVSGKHFVRFVVGCGVVRWWLSADGSSWADVQQSVGCDTTRLLRWGIDTASDSRLVVRKVSFREFGGIRRSLQADCFERATRLPTSLEYSQWLEHVAESRPVDCDLQQWTACSAVAQLAGGGLQNGDARLVGLVAENAVRDTELAVPARLDALHQLALLLDESNDTATSRHLSRYQRLGLMQLERVAGRPFSAIRAHWMNLPLSSEEALRAVPDQIATAELVRLMNVSQWDEALELCRVLEYFHLGQRLPIFDWATSKIASHTLRPEPFTIQQRRPWRELFPKETDELAYQMAADFQTDIQNEDWDGIAERIAQIAIDDMPSGYAPSIDDERLLQTLPAALIDLHARHGQLTKTMKDRYSGLAEMRVSQATAADDPQAVEFAAKQFAPTPAAAAAQRWLAERALAAGWLGEARGHFAKAADSWSDDSNVESRRSLIELLMSDREMKVENVRSGSLTLNRSDVASLRRALAPAYADSQVPSLPGLWDPTGQERAENQGLRVTGQSKITGAGGRYPERATIRQVGTLDVDWVGRQLSIAGHGNAIYLSNRFQVHAIDSTSGDLLWQSELPDARAGLAQDWSLVPMRPTLVGDQIFVRLLYGDGPVLACLDRHDGRLLWTTSLNSTTKFASDPWWTHDQLFCLAVTPGELDWLSLQLVRIDPATGAVWGAREILKLDTTWQLRRVCQTRVDRDSVFVVLGGITVCIDKSGGIRWLRENLTIPVDADPHWVEQEHQPPLIAGESLFVSQPGVRSASCLNPETGTLRWQRVLPSILGMIDVVNGTLLIRERTGLRGLDARTGETRWLRDLEPEGVVQLDGHGGRLVVVRQPAVRQPSRESHLVIEMIDLDSGAKQEVGIGGSFGTDRIRYVFIRGAKVWIVHGADGDPARTLTRLAR